MKQKRREFLKFAGMTAAASLCFSPAAALASGGGAGGAGHAVPEAGALTAQRWAMVIDTRKLNTEEAIERLAHACHSVHNVPHFEDHQNIKWTWPAEYSETFTEQLNPHLDDEVKERAYMLMCNHCTNPPCVRVCPTQATYQRPDGIVAMDYHRCIGCRYCMAGCPFGARSFNFRDPRLGLDLAHLNMEFPTRMRGVVEKCNFCVERLAKGQIPACVEASGGALTFGDLENPSDPVRQVLRENFTLRRKPAAGTEPGVYYII